MNWMALIDGRSAVIVLGGTALATLLRCGPADCRVALRKLAWLRRATFNAGATRAELAGQIQEIRRDGLYRAEPHHFADSEFEEVTGALLERRSLAALLDRHAAHKARRLVQSERAVRTLAQGAELAPVFGLAGTLVSLSQLPADGLVRGAFTGAIAMAVTTTLYGLLLANLVLAPLARRIERAALAEEVERQTVIDWLTEQIHDAMPPRGLGRAA
ncbi:MAG: MotA/TolQ/ExbB proton channel family protein [Sphingomonadales bacterium]|nr:MotA/TolQ/ExbB proton channel family protein [Sphingomonadales bacterium]